MNPVVAAVEQHGLLLLQDKSLPNAVTVITGEHPRGSWWSHPRSHAIFRILDQASDDPNIISTKLLGGKVTFVHRALWPALLAIGNAREPWQLLGLPPEAGRLLRRIDQSGQLRVSGAAAKELEQRLLVRSDQVHTESGRHESVLETWPRWASAVKLRTSLTADEARKQLDRAVAALGGEANLLPWHRFSTSRSKPRTSRSGRSR